MNSSIKHKVPGNFSILGPARGGGAFFLGFSRTIERFIFARSVVPGNRRPTVGGKGIILKLRLLAGVRRRVKILRARAGD